METLIPNYAIGLDERKLKRFSLIYPDLGFAEILDFLILFCSCLYRTSKFRRNDFIQKKPEMHPAFLIDRRLCNKDSK